MRACPTRKRSMGGTIQTLNSVALIQTNVETKVAPETMEGAPGVRIGIRIPIASQRIDGLEEGRMRQRMLRFDANAVLMSKCMNAGAMS